MVGQVRLELTRLSAPVFETGLFTYYSTIPYWWVKPESNWQALRRQLLRLLCLPISPFTHINKYLTGSDWPCQCTIPLQATLYTRYGQHTYDYADNFLRYLYWSARRESNSQSISALELKSNVYTNSTTRGYLKPRWVGTPTSPNKGRRLPVPSSRLYIYIIY